MRHRDAILERIQMFFFLKETFQLQGEENSVS